MCMVILTMVNACLFPTGCSWSHGTHRLYPWPSPCSWLPHSHDSLLVKRKVPFRHIKGIRTVLTIWPIWNFKVNFLKECYGIVWCWVSKRYADGTLRWNDCLNWMKAGILRGSCLKLLPLAMRTIMTSQFGCGLTRFFDGAVVRFQV